MKLTIRDDTEKTVEQELGPGSYKVGRGEGCEVLLDDETVSREHCIIEVLAEKSVLRDLGSMNGTTLNDKRVDEAELKDGDVIALGKTKITISLGGAAKEEASAEGAAEAAQPKEEGGEAPESGDAGEEAKPSESES